MSIRGIRINWRCGTIGPPWFRRFLQGWRWYRSGNGLVSLTDVLYILDDKDLCECKKAALRKAAGLHPQHGAEHAK